MKNSVLPNSPSEFTTSQISGAGNAEDLPQPSEREIFNGRASAREALDHLRNASAELGYLRRRCEVLEAQMRVVTIFEAVAIGRQAAMMGGVNTCGTVNGGGGLDYFLTCHEAGEREKRESVKFTVPEAEINRLADWLQVNAADKIKEGSAVDNAIAILVDFHGTWEHPEHP